MASAGPTKCDIIRDAVTAGTCGMCKAIGTQPPLPIPAGCGTPPPVAACMALTAADTRMKLFAARMSPRNLVMGATDRAILVQTEKNYQAGIQAAEAALAAAYPGAEPGATAISWPDIQRCLWSPDGSPHGASKAVYFGRNDAITAGMGPMYPVGGGKLAAGAFGGAGFVPLAVDYIMNPGLFAVLVLAFLVALFAALLWAARRRARAAPYLADRAREAARRAREAADPYRGSAFESYPDPRAKCRDWVEAQEALGFNMAAYRRRCGLPQKP